MAEGLALWRGPAYADIPHPFAEAEAARLDGLRIAAVELAAELDLATGRHEEVAQRLRHEVGFQVDVGHVSFFGRCRECGALT